MIIQLYRFTASSLLNAFANNKQNRNHFSNRFNVFWMYFLKGISCFIFYFLVTYCDAFWLFAVVCDISMCQCSPSRDCIAVRSHKPGHLQSESMQNVENLLLHRHQNYNYYCCFDYYCCAIVLTALMLCWINPDSLFAKRAPSFYFRLCCRHKSPIHNRRINQLIVIKFAHNLFSTNYGLFQHFVWLSCSNDIDNKPPILIAIWRCTSNFSFWHHETIISN